MDMTTLRVEGEVQAPREFAFAELAALSEQILDVGSLIPGRQGGAIWLRDLLDVTGVHPHATHVTLHATDGDFSASIPLAAVRDRALIVYRMGEAPLPVDQGGPIRFLITSLAHDVSAGLPAVLDGQVVYHSDRLGAADLAGQYARRAVDAEKRRGDGPTC